MSLGKVVLYCNVLNRREWSTDNLCCCPHPCLQWFPVRGTACSRPEWEVTRQNKFYFLTESYSFWEEKLIPQDHDALLWWKNNAATLPSLSNTDWLTETFFFSEAGQLLSHSWRAIKRKNVNMILFLNKIL